MRATLGWLALAVALGGCVTKKKYNELQSQYTDLEARYATLQSSEAGLRVEVTDLEEHVTMLRQSNDYLGSFYADLLDEFRPQLENEEMEVIVYPDRLSLALAQDVTFSSGSARLTRAGGSTLGSLSELLARHPERRFHVEGHTDSVPIDNGRYDSNWELGAARAVAVVESLIAAGVPAERLAVTSYGETQPLAPNDDPEGRKVNRRVEISFQPTLEELPGHRTLVDAARTVVYAHGADQNAVPEIARDPGAGQAKAAPVAPSADTEELTPLEDLDGPAEQEDGGGGAAATSKKPPSFR
jgi:chemotaxis protein MotB